MDLPFAMLKVLSDNTFGADLQRAKRNCKHVYMKEIMKPKAPRTREAQPLPAKIIFGER